MIKKLNKRGSHVSFIISFILFISFIIFFISIIKPFEKAESGKSSLLKHLENEIIKNVSEDVEVVSALESVGGSSSCSDINLIINNKKNVLESYGDFSKIYISNEFTSSEFLCVPQDKYELGLIRTQNYVFYSKILKLNESYEDNYESLKENFGIPGTNDFEFSLLDIREIPITKTNSKEIPSTEAFAELIPAIYFDENSEIKNGYIKVVLW